MLKAFIAGAFGVLVSSVGMDIITGYSRFTFGTLYLKGGLPFIPLIIGLFAFSEVLYLVRQSQKTISEKGKLTGKILNGLMEPWKHPKTLARSSLIGLGIGVIPGEGAAIANFTAYLAEAKASKRTDAFGTGIPEGVIAPEASNNACVAGALIPTLTLGIPGGGVAAVFLGGLMIHGLNPGIELFTRHKEVLYTLFFGLILANFLILICGTLLSRYAAKVTIIPINILAPIIIALGITSTYLMRSNVVDVFLAIIAGIIGYFMKKYEYSPVSFLVAFILAPIAERSFFQALIVADGSYLTFVVRPISGSLLLLSILVIVLPAVLKKIKKNGDSKLDILNPKST
jgi:putative tricarboxylic transport membrane protein